jgi:glutamate--cysteine ligase
MTLNHPYLDTSLYSKAFIDLEQQVFNNISNIERWFRLMWQDYTPPFYCSVDLRCSGFKLASIDANLFPGGFNNLPCHALPIAAQAASAFIEKMCCDSKSILVIPEKHTRNTFYLKNIEILCKILKMSGLDVRLGRLDESQQSIEITFTDGSHLNIEELKRIGTHAERLGLEGFTPCSILLNNDLSSGVPAILQNLNEQTIVPPIHAGWTTRKKSKHFEAYQDITQKFADMLGIDSWLINPYFNVCQEVNFNQRVGFDCLQQHVSDILEKTRIKYKQYGITQPPYVVLKANAGTYGMGIMMIQDAKELDEVNRKTRNKMSVIKEGLEVSEILVQEGVHTIEQVNNLVAEPVIYMMDKYVIGGFYRAHQDKSLSDNLNSPGMLFTPMEQHVSQAMLELQDTQDYTPENRRFYVYSIVARLALLACAIELESSKPKSE